MVVPRMSPTTKNSNNFGPMTLLRPGASARSATSSSTVVSLAIAEKCAGSLLTLAAHPGLQFGKTCASGSWAVRRNSEAQPADSAWSPRRTRLPEGGQRHRSEQRAHHDQDTAADACEPRSQPGLNQAVQHVCQPGAAGHHHREHALE